MTDYDEAIWTLRYRRYPDQDLEKVIALGGEHGALAAAILAARRR